MRAIIAPHDNPRLVYETCINSIVSDDLRNRLTATIHFIDHASTDYLQKANIGQLYVVPQINCHNNEIALGDVTKEELKDVYSSHMVGKSKPARAIYDSLLSRAPMGRCPFCGIGQASTLDHYLPKTKYPQLSVLPLNLIPSCKDCNTGKSTNVPLTTGEQCLHPYFDHQHFIDEQWLYARVNQTTPVTISFYVQEPIHWDETSKSRVRSHFRDFKLSSRFAVETANQLACLRDTLSSYNEMMGPEAVKQHLAIEAHSWFEQHKNSWQTAMFQALANCDWYSEEEFL